MGGKCAGCQISVSSGLEWHNLPRVANEPARRVRLCPVCHCTQHLDAAGLADAGVMIWLPEVQQSTLNLMCNIIFAASSMHKVRPSALPANAETGEISAEDIKLSRQVAHLESLYRTFMSRAASIHGVVGHKNSTVDVTNPAYFADLVLKARARGASNAAINQKLDGIRFLPIPKPFADFRAVVQSEVLTKYPLSSWQALLPQEMPVAEGMPGNAEQS